MSSILNRIQIGHKNAIQRSSNLIQDRKDRADIEDANHNGEIIINVGDGYYIPDPLDPVDEMEFRKYLAKEKARARKIQSKVLNMSLTYERYRFEAECGGSRNGT